MKKTSTTPPFIITLFSLFLIEQVRARVQPGPEPSPPIDYNSRRPPREVIVVALLSCLFFIAFYFIYLCCCIDDRFTQLGTWSGWRRRPWGNFAASSGRLSSKSTSNTLDPELVKSFPTFQYGDIKSAMITKGRTLECAVCLTEFHDKDVLRLIPKCDHVFHADCVDDWLVGHATCPVCRLNLADVDFWDDPQNDVVICDDDKANGSPRMRSLSSPLSTTRRPRLLVGLSRSLSTGHLAVKQWEEMERYTLRLPWEVRKQIMRSRSLRFGNDKVDLTRKSDTWVFSLTPSFHKDLNNNNNNNNNNDNNNNNNKSNYKFAECVSAKSTITINEVESSIEVVSIDEPTPTQLPV